MKRLNFSWCILLIANYCYCQDNTDLDSLINELSKINAVHHQFVSVYGETTDHYLNFENLKRIASTTELVALVKSKNSVLSCYAAWALSDKRYADIALLFEELLNENKNVNVLKGCILSKGNVAEELYYRMSNSNHWVNDTSFYAIKISKLDSIILYNDNSTKSLIYNALQSTGKNIIHYPRIKQLVLEKYNEDALIALAKYNKENDIPIIKQFKTKSFLPISHFPHSDFWEFLLKYEKRLFEKNFNVNQFFIAIASFKNDSSLAILKKYATNESLTSNIHDALTFNNDNLYLDLLIEIWEKYRIIDLASLKRIAAKRPNEIVRIVENGLLSNHSSFEFKDTVNDYSSGKMILPEMLSILSQGNSTKIIEVVNLNLIRHEFYELENLTDWIIRFKLKESVSTMFKKVKTETRAFDIFHLSSAILSFDNPEWNQALLEILEDQRRWDWGNWSKSFRELFEEYGFRLK